MGRRARTVGAVAGALVLTILLVVVVGAAQRAERSGRATVAGSSFRADESGHRAVRLLLDSLGWDVRSRRGARLPRGTGHVLIRVEGLPGAGTGGVPERERRSAGAALARWVEAGNGVLLLASEAPLGSGFPAVRARFDVPTPAFPMGPLPVPGNTAALEGIFGERPDVPRAGGGVVEEHAMPGLGDPWITPYHVVSARPADTVLATRTEDGDAQPVIVETTRGRGRVIVVADPWFATNVRLAQGDNAAWMGTLVERLAAGGEVWFDDRAMGQSATRGVLSLFQEEGFGAALLAGFLLLLLVWWRVGPSDAPDRLVRPRKDYRPEAYAELRAGLYAACLTPADVRRTVRAEVARRLSRGDGTPYERVLAMLRARDPERAERVEAAVAALPQHRDVSVTKFAGSWSAAVSKVWVVLGERPGEAATTIAEDV